MFKVLLGQVQRISFVYESNTLYDIRDLMKFRNTNSAFGLDGECITEVNGSELTIIRKCGEYSSILKANLKTYEFSIN